MTSPDQAVWESDDEALYRHARRQDRTESDERAEMAPVAEGWDDCIVYTGREKRYQTAAAEAYYVETASDISSWAWITTHCGIDCLNPEHMRFKAPRKLEYPSGVCIYCGRRAWTEDHLLPRNWSGATRRSYVVTVPACGPCNNHLSDTLTWSITERRAICQLRLKRKFRKVLKYVEFGPTDLAEFGSTLRASVIEGMNKKEEVMRMLAWPEDPYYDLRACQRSGIDDPYAIGLLLTDMREVWRIAMEVA